MENSTVQVKVAQLLSLNLLNVFVNLGYEAVYHGKVCEVGYERTEMRKTALMLITTGVEKFEHRIMIKY